MTDITHINLFYVACAVRQLRRGEPVHGKKIIAAWKWFKKAPSAMKRDVVKFLRGIRKDGLDRDDLLEPIPPPRKRKIP